MPRMHVAIFSRPITAPAVSRIGVLAAVTASVALAGCAGGASNPLSLAESSSKITTADTSQPKTELQKAAEYWGEQFRNNPTDAQAALNYARNLKALGAKPQATQVLQAAHNVNPTHKTINSELGRLVLEQDQVAAAQKLLEQADDPVNGDWKTISARGTVLAKQGKYREAIQYFERARNIAPEQSSVLNNLALAHAMDGRAEKAENLLRDALQKAPDDERIAQNLSLVLSLQGKHDESKSILAKAVPADQAADDANYLKQMVRTDPVKAAVVAEKPVAPAKSASVSGQAPIATSSVRPAPGKSMAVAADDAAAQVLRLADGHTATPADQPISLVPKR